MFGRPLTHAGLLALLIPFAGLFGAVQFRRFRQRRWRRKD